LERFRATAPLGARTPRLTLTPTPTPPLQLPLPCVIPKTNWLSWNNPHSSGK
jgi:hypothetical protein